MKRQPASFADETRLEGHVTGGGGNVQDAQAPMYVALLWVHRLIYWSLRRTLHFEFIGVFYQITPQGNASIISRG